MHSFHRSRGKIVVEVLCAFGLSASCVGAWLQTGASALLWAASVATFYGVFHAFDLGGRRAADVAGPAAVDFAPAQRTNLLADEGTASHVTEAEQQSTTDTIIEKSELVDAPAREAPERRRTKAPRKSGARRAGAPKEVKVNEHAPAAEAELAVPAAAQDEATELAPPSDDEAGLPPGDQEAAQVPLAPLFEPEPFVRQQRAVFGRKAG